MFASATNHPAGSRKTAWVEDTAVACTDAVRAELMLLRSWRMPGVW